MNRVEKIKEEYRNILINWIDEDYNREYVACEIVSESDKFAIDFAKWLNNGRFTQYGSYWINPKLSKDLNGDWVFFTSEKLLEIYKKEK